MEENPFQVVGPSCWVPVPSPQRPHARWQAAGATQKLVDHGFKLLLIDELSRQKRTTEPWPCTHPQEQRMEFYIWGMIFLTVPGGNKRNTADLLLANVGIQHFELLR